jgi:hypothetical protein
VTSFAALSQTTLPWHELELSLTVSGDEGAVEVALDGVPQLTLSGIDTGSVLTNLVMVGLTWTKSEQPTSVVIDDVVIDDAFHALPLSLP